jgi:hypothetical protein
VAQLPPRADAVARRAGLSGLVDSPWLPGKQMIAGGASR